MNRPQTRSVSLALGRLRWATVFACWLIGLALATQTTVWALAHYTDMRFEVVEDGAEAPLVVQAESKRQQRIHSVRASELGLTVDSSESNDEDADEQASPVPSRADHRLGAAFNLAAGIGRAAILAVLPVMALGVLLGVVAQTSGIERATTAFLLMLVVSGLVLPLGDVIGLPWPDGALTSYATLTTALDQPESAATPLPAYIQFLLLPLTAIVGVLIVAVRFTSGVEASLPSRESMRLDPNLEREASNMSPTSLHGGRAGSVLQSTLGQFDGKLDDQAENGPTAREVSRGETPKRLI